MTFEDVIAAHITAAWITALQAAYTLARAERLQELRDKRVRLLDERGLHPFSLECGRVLGCQELLPDLSFAGFNAWEIKRAARDDARQEYWEEIHAGYGATVA